MNIGVEFGSGLEFASDAGTACPGAFVENGDNRFSVFWASSGPAKQSAAKIAHIFNKRKAHSGRVIETIIARGRMLANETRQVILQSLPCETASLAQC
ncbi:MAG: hypothetical protein WCF22_19240 [Candidatus Sulfotelmatobacter sp.]